MAETDWRTLLAIAGLGLITVLARNFFMISQRRWQLPQLVQRGLQYAPIAALAAVVAPDIMLTAGELAPLWRDARFWSAVAAAAYYFWRRGDSLVLPAAIGVGMLVFLPLRLGLGW